MLGTGQSRHNTHTGQTTVRQGDMLIDGSLRVRGDLIIDGTLVFNSDVTINPPACLNTDCINSVSGTGIDIGDDVNLINNGNNKLITNSINTANIGTGLRINEDYTLPPNTSTNSIGDVLTLTNVGGGFSTASFQTPTSATGRVVQNLFQMTNPRTSYNPIAWNPLYVNSNGSDIINTSDIAVGGSVRFRTKGYLYNGTVGVTAFGQFQLIIGIPNNSGAFDFYTNQLFIRDVGMSAGDPNIGRGWWEINVTVTKINASNDCTVGVSGLYNCVASTGVGSDTFDIQFYELPLTFTDRLPNNSSSNTVTPAPYWSTLPANWELRLLYKETSAAAAAIPTEYTIDYLNVDQSVLATVTAPATDHLTLANLNGGTGDGGHINLYDRRGVKPMTGTMNMNQNQIENVNVINNTSANLQIIGQSSQSAIELDPNPTDGININANTKNINVIANGDLLLKSNTSFLDIDSNLIRFLNAGVPAGQIDAAQWEIFKNVSMTNNNIININDASANRVLTDTLESQLGGDITSNNNIDMNNNNISNVNQVSSSGILTLLGALGNRCDIGVGGATRLEVEDTRVFISQFADLNIHGQVIWVKPNTMPNFFQGDTTYIFVGSRNTSNNYVLPANVKIMGTGKNNSIINYNGGSSLFSSVNENLSVSDITLTSSNNSGKLFDCSNVAQDKTINMTNVQIRNTKNGMQTVGYDLIDLNNCIFTYFESGSPSPVGVKITDCSKLQLSSCEFLRWFQEGGTPATTFFNGNMLDLNGTLNALNITGSFFHPQYDQNGIDTTLVSSVIEGTISSNTFIDINLNTPAFQVLVVNPTIAPSYVIEGNSIYPNLRSQVTYVLSATNTTQTDLSTNNPNTLNTAGLAIGLVTQFATLTTGGLITYLKKRSANFIITASANLEVVAGGAGQQVGLGLRVNGVDIPLAYSYVTLDSAGTAPKQCTLNFTGLANQNDTFELTIFNASGNNNVIASYVNFAGIEI